MKVGIDKLSALTDPRGRSARLVCLVGAFLCGCLLASTASAQVVVLDFTGPKAAGARAEVVKALLKDDVELVQLDDAEARASRLQVDLDDDDGRLAVAREDGLSAFVAGNVERKGKNFSLTVTVYSGHDGAAVGDAEVSARRAAFRKRIRAAIGRDLGALLERTRVPEKQVEEEVEEPEEPEEEPEEQPRRRQEPVDEEEPEEDEASDGAEDGPKAFEFGLMLSLLSRSYAYKDAVLTMSNHDLLLNPSPTISLRFYPMALSGDGFLAHLGIDFRFSYLLFASSERNGIEYTTNSSDLRIGLRGRIPAGDHELGLGVAYGVQSTGFDKGSDGSEPGVPNVSYGHLRFGLDGRVDLGGASVQPAVALLLPLGLGDVGADPWFPHASGLGFDSALHLGIALGDSFELLLGGSFRQWGLALKPEVSDEGVVNYGRAAGGVTDRYFTIDAGFALRL